MLPNENRSEEAPLEIRCILGMFLGEVKEFIEGDPAVVVPVRPGRNLLKLSEARIRETFVEDMDEHRGRNSARVVCVEDPKRHPECVTPIFRAFAVDEGHDDEELSEVEVIIFVPVEQIKEPVGLNQAQPA
eukprot:CAMPEP_0185754552 /NCGR_PEP_ID=MMETSP1174-20130828/13192_1 /TAXON_ID=35687 /ORGANISM="Dictyocha speculum, Strain CCMP1381" /LENGTH=130 /DNA_ID=CAMNT_0028432813 /DNA_START=244 /DNA_END=633 /DNA_ORIENTATION=-